MWRVVVLDACAAGEARGGGKELRNMRKEGCAVRDDSAGDDVI